MRAECEARRRCRGADRRDAAATSRQPHGGGSHRRSTHAALPSPARPPSSSQSSNDLSWGYCGAQRGDIRGVTLPLEEVVHADRDPRSARGWSPTGPGRSRCRRRARLRWRRRTPAACARRPPARTPGRSTRRGRRTPWPRRRRCRRTPRPASACPATEAGTSVKPAPDGCSAQPPKFSKKYTGRTIGQRQAEARASGSRSPTCSRSAAPCCRGRRRRRTSTRSGRRRPPWPRRRGSCPGRARPPGRPRTASRRRTRRSRRSNRPSTEARSVRSARTSSTPRRAAAALSRRRGHG